MVDMGYLEHAILNCKLLLSKQFSENKGPHKNQNTANILMTNSVLTKKTQYLFKLVAVGRKRFSYECCDDQTGSLRSHYLRTKELLFKTKTGLFETDELSPNKVNSNVNVGVTISFRDVQARIQKNQIKRVNGLTITTQRQPVFEGKTKTEVETVKCSHA